MCAFLNKTTAEFNIKYFIPLLYILHILPFHVIIILKKQIYTNNKIKENQEKIYDKLIFPRIFFIIKSKLDTFVTFNPLSPQGMMIFGLITSYYKLK